MFPGMDEIFSLATVRDHVRSGNYDVIVVDCAPTAETLRLLSLPEVLSWYMEKMFPIGRRVAKVVRPVLSRVTNMPVADDKVFEAVVNFYARLDGIREILADPEITSARLVMNPEKDGHLRSSAHLHLPRAIRVCGRLRHREPGASRFRVGSLLQAMA